MNEPSIPKWDTETKMRAIGAVVGAVVAVMIDGRGGVFAAFALMCGGGLGALTVMTRTLAEGWQGWAASVGLWWMLPLVMYWAA
jgi:hypothetical protein